MKHDPILEVTRQFDLLFHVLGQNALVLCGFLQLRHSHLFLCPLSSVLTEVQLALVLAEAGAIRQKHKFIFIVLAQSSQFLLDGPALALPLHPISPSPLVLLDEGPAVIIKTKIIKGKSSLFFLEVQGVDEVYHGVELVERVGVLFVVGEEDALVGGEQVVQLADDECAVEDVEEEVEDFLRVDAFVDDGVVDLSNEADGELGERLPELDALGVAVLVPVADVELYLAVEFHLLHNPCGEGVEGLLYLPVLASDLRQQLLPVP